VTLTCAFAGRTAVHKKIKVSNEKEVKGFIRFAAKNRAPF